jgi:hypothetical protein
MNLDPDKLNANCACISLDHAALTRELDAVTGDAGFGARLAASHPTLLSNLPLYLRPEHIASMAGIIRAIEDVAKLPVYEASALAGAPAIAQFKPGAIGVFMGYDFHLGADGPKLIEINTNAGGAVLNALLARAQMACCAAASPMLATPPVDGGPEAAFVASFRAEWQRQRPHATPLKTIAIVDDAPATQFLYPEFVLCKSLLEAHGITTLILAPSQLTYTGTRLEAGGRGAGGQAIDLVYNRLTDFSLEQPANAPLRAAYLANHVVLTPNPWAHAVFADKRNLTRLTNPELLHIWGVDADTIATLISGIPKTFAVTAGNANDLWSRRNKLFFKPASGFASKAAYRGDKVTKRVWETIAAGGYIAQDLVQPGTRTIDIDGTRQALKADIRNYTYDGTVQLIAARLYQGQTTNFRTPGGGFAPVLPATFGPTLACCLPGTEGVACL